LFCDAAAQRVILFMFKLSFTIVSNIKPQYSKTYSIYVFRRTGVTRCPTEDKSVHLVNKTNLVNNLFLVYLSISTCFGRLYAHHQEKQMCLCDTWHLLFCVDDFLVCRGHPDKYTKNKLCNKLALFTRLIRDARSTKHKTYLLK
jgi:hypothetical protein